MRFQVGDTVQMSKNADSVEFSSWDRQCRDCEYELKIADIDLTRDEWIYECSTYDGNTTQLRERDLRLRSRG